MTDTDPTISAGASPEPDAQLALPASAPASEDEGRRPDPAPAETLRPVAPLELSDLTIKPPPTNAPMMEWMVPTDLLVEEAYQRNLSPKSLQLIRRIVEGFDWRRFKPPIVAWTEQGFEIIDGQHTAIAAAMHPDVEKIPVLVVLASDVGERAAAFIGHNRDRLAVTAVQMHVAAVAAGDPDAIELEEVCTNAGVHLVRSPHGEYPWQIGDTAAVKAIGALIKRQGPSFATQILTALVTAEVAPITANHIKATEAVLTDPVYCRELEPMPRAASDLASAIKKAGAAAMDDAKLYAGPQNVPLWKALGSVWFAKCRKRRGIT